MKIKIQVLLLLLFIIVIGICAGAFYEVFLCENDKVSLGTVLDKLFLEAETPSSEQNDQSNPFWYCLLNELKSGMPVLVVGFISPILFPVLIIIPIYILSKGFIIGFLSAILIENFGVDGILIIIKTVFLPNLIQIPVICFLAANSLFWGKRIIKLFFSRQKNESHRNQKNLQRDVCKYCIVYGIGVIIIIISFVIEAFLLTLTI